ncbi:cardiolipin synthase [Alkalispirochaeta americana]|uniref:Cardiolipin synthase n=1 Tax=Alkalispirochaeta americana TaxID=159291 RepID=A0A1N6TJG2_9SPIO|nr:cardiolipin synthase [Alkalispirochaeta americana]SIQ53473.1 cardiolipin synthase [Alkalispirochaeta americana]
MILALVVALAQILGVLSSISALLTARTSQGAIAWIVSLNTFPYLAVPLYWIFGRSRFKGYVDSRKAVDHQFRDHQDRLMALLTLLKSRRYQHDTLGGRILAVERIAELPFTGGNAVELLENGEEGFCRMFEAIRRAERYVLVQFYIVRADRIGQELKNLLLDRAAAGVKVFFLYDEIGSYKLPGRYLRDLREGGVRVTTFSSTRGKRNRFQINFRNHRKVLVVDGHVGYVGGLNVGDEYLGRDPRFGPWRDTHLEIAGPAVVGLQLPFVEDWHWATGEHLELEWGTVMERTYPQGHNVLVVPSGPADEFPTAGLMVQHAIHSAQRVLWIASPYFVPDEGVQDALKLAVLRGVDVRILIPDRPDHMLVFFSAFAFLGPMLEAGVRVYRYLPGFLHQKVFLVDDQVVGIGTVNLDNRSFRLNFEITAIVLGKRFAGRVRGMLLADFSRSREMIPEDVSKMPLRLRLASRVSYLFAPIQ